MSLSRARTRFATLLAAIPLVVAVAPFVSPAYAVDPVRQADIATTQGALRIGPHAGFRGDVTRGIEGHTAIAAITVATSTTITSVTVTIDSSPTFTYDADYDGTDGFALYKDLNNNDHLDQADYAAGIVSQPSPVPGAANNTATVTVLGDPAKATGVANYLLVVHPKSTATGQRTVFITIPAGDVVTSAGNMPASTVTLNDLVFDAQPPAAIPYSNFNVVSRPPVDTCAGLPVSSCGNDSYTAYFADPVEPDELLGFFNNATDFTDGAALKLPDDSIAIYPMAGIGTAANQATSYSVGNGTGITAAGMKALNNQINDDVYAVQWDPMGNTTPVDKFTNAKSCASPSGCTETNPNPKGNDVTAPTIATWTVTMDPANASTPSLSAVGVHATVSSPDTSVPTNTPQAPVYLLAKPQELQKVGTTFTPVAGHDGTEVRGSAATTPGTTPNNVSNAAVDVSSATLFPQDNYVWSAARLVDVAGNATAVKDSNAVIKDTTKPSFVRVSLIDGDGDHVADPGEQFRVEFNDPMDTTKITAANIAPGFATPTLAVTDPAVTTPCGSGANIGTPCRSWGTGATVSWSDPQILLITLGTECPPLPAPPGPGCSTSTYVLPSTGNVVTASAAVTDNAGNTMVSPPTITITAPIVLPAQARTIDTVAGTGVWNTGRDGKLDAIDVKFSGELSSSSVDDSSADGLWEVDLLGTHLGATATLLPAVCPSPPATCLPRDTVHLTFNVPSAHAAEWNTGATPRVTLSANGQGSTEVFTTSNPVQAIVPFNLTSVDRAAPVPLSVTTADTTKDGHLDRVIVKYSEPIQPAKENVCGYLVTGYADPNYKPTGFPTTTTCTPSGANGFAAGTTSDTVVLTLNASTSPTVFDTGATPLVAFRANAALAAQSPAATPPDCDGYDPTNQTASPDCPVVDLPGNGLESFSGNAADAVGPVIVARGTEDGNSDGRIDRIRVTYSESVSTPSVAAAQFQVTEPAYTVTSLSIPSGTEILVNVQPTTSALGDTDAKPKLTFLGGTTDTANPPNASPTDTGVVVTDTAGPAIMGACAGGTAGSNGQCPVDDATNDYVELMFSETIDATTVTTSGDLTTDFVVEQPAGTNKVITGVLVEPDNKRVKLTFANTAIDPAAAGVVRFKAAAVVKDNATVKNNNTQTANVPLIPAPTVTLALSCPTPATPGFCGANQVNTGAAGSPGVSSWRLATTARATTPPASEFSSTVPTVYPESGVLPEGTLTLYLSGKDIFDRLSPEVSSSIRIVKPPHINNVQFVDSRIARTGTWSTSQTFLDGDSVRIGADAQGSDSLEWAANNAVTGGGCLAQYMSADLRALTAKSNQSAVAPIKCDYKTTTSPPFRQMQFPTVTVTRTTHYPVGTVLRPAGTADQGYLVVDGPSGTQLRRHFISPNARRSWQISDAQVINVPAAVITGMAAGTPVGYRDGAIVKGSGTPYYYVIVGHKKPISTATLASLHIPLSTAYNLTPGELKAMLTTTGVGPGAHLPGMFVKFSSGTIQEIAYNRSNVIVRRAVTGGAVRTRITGTQIFPANAKDAALPLDSWVVGYRDGTLLQTPTGYAVVSRASLRTFANSTTFNTLGYSTSNAMVFSSPSMPHVAGQSYRSGALINRYSITGVVIKVTNKAGATTTAIVLPSVPGLYAVGTLDPVPSGWDFSHS